jgi:hypothetical protein
VAITVGSGVGENQERERERAREGRELGEERVARNKREK